VQPSTNPDYDARLRAILESGDSIALREFSRAENQIPDEVYAKEEHFWEVLLHKLICNRLDMLIAHASSRAWLSERGYSTDLAGY
jgi:hypothetical protein